MRELLFLCHRLPYPPNKGDKIRSWNIFRYLSERFRVHVGCFVDNPDDRKHEALIRERCGESLFVRLDRRAAVLRAAGAMVSGRPFTLGYYHDARLARWVGDLMATNRIDIVFAFSSSMAPYAFAKGTGTPLRIADFVDVDSDKWRQYALRKRWPMRAVFSREALALLRFERRVARESSAVLFVSQREAELFAALAPESRQRIRVVANGVDDTYFTPVRHYENPYPVDVAPIVFTGAMDYWPNVDAAAWFATEILPRVVTTGARAHFFVVGSDPTPAVRALGRLPRVTVTGRVADVRPYLAHATAAVAPLRIARGIQNKVLEAMAMARVVITTSCGLEGIDAEPGRHVRIADDAACFGRAVSEAIERNENETLGTHARSFILRRYRWSETLKSLDGLVALGPTGLTDTRTPLSETADTLRVV